MKIENIVSHPSHFISKEDTDIIRNIAGEAEKTGMLHAEQLEVIYTNKWFRLLVPNAYNGQQVTLLNLLQQQEAISWADGSTGWVVTLCNGAGWFGGFISPEIAPGIFSDEHVCLAGSGAATGTAEITANGYRVNGAWKYASGIHHATHITANCIITKNGEPVLNGDEPLIRPFIFDRKDVAIVPAWKYTGMVATGSDAFEIKDLQVAANRRFQINPTAAVITVPIYLYPFHQLAETTIAVTLSGMAIHFIDLCKELFTEKQKHVRLSDRQKALLTKEIEAAEAKIEERRNMFYDAVECSWEAIDNSNIIPDEVLKTVSNSSHILAQISREIVDGLYPLCGLAAAHTGTEINRVWRDLHTASQHSLLTFGPAES
jgi:alkylation response protein AidB-like acyl-CoA dehydrogenase